MRWLPIKPTYRRDKRNREISNLDEELMSHFPNDKNLIFILADILYNKDFQKIILGKKYKEGVALSLAICLSDARTWATLR